MDEVRAFFNSRTSHVTRLRGSLTDGVFLSQDSNLNELNRREDHRRSVLPCGTDYVHQVRERENEMYRQNEMERMQQDGSMPGGLESLERLTSIGASTTNIEMLTDEAMTEVYSKYTFQRKENTDNLPINDMREQILEGIRGFAVTIIEGPTGCGKTTQVPQWILDDCYQKHLPCKIIVTQPRRIAAISIARRVAQERGWDVGGLVGYQVGLENKTTSDSRIMYVTTGVLLQKLVGAKSIKEYTHIILDEVHERGQEMDFLLLVVKKLLFTSPSNVKVILMSATFNSDKFRQFFSIPNRYGLPNSVCFKVHKKDSMFPVKTFYLNNLKFGEVLEKCWSASNEPGINPEMHHLVLRLINAFERIDEQEDEIEDRSEADLPSVLIFLPGINEIEELFNCLNDMKLRKTHCGQACVEYKWWVLPLHSTITADEQVRVFHRAPPGHRKIILATNIAESSITVPDVKYVIDYCLMKTLVADEHTNFTSLQLSWASKTNCDQRAGRAGRVREGRVYRLVTTTFYEKLQHEPVPEIIRCPLERLVLLAKMLEMGPPSDILALAMDPPDMSNIRRTLLVLKEIGALKKTVDDMWSDSDGDITYLGRVMAKLPLDVKVSKMIMLGYIFGVLDQCVAMAAAMSVKNLFSSPFRERLNAYNSKLTWADGSTSDCIALYHVYQVWCHLRQQNYFKHNNEHHWARKFFVQARALREMDDLVRELKHRLSKEGIEPIKATSAWNRHNETLAFKVVIAGAFYPQFFIQSSTCEDRERDAVKILGGLDPRDTVYLKDFPTNQPGEVYAAAIKNVIRQAIHDEPTVTFDKNSQKVFLTFGDSEGLVNNSERKGDPTIPGQVLLPVYKSIKARQLRMDIRIPLLPVERAQELATALEVSKLNMSELECLVPRLPDINQTHFPLKISQLITVSKFWVQYDDESTAEDLHRIYQTLNSRPLIAHTGAVRAGDMHAAPYNNGMQRARVMKLLPRDMVQVLYIDWGTIAQVNTTNLRVIPAGICTSTPPLAMRCRLSGIAPAPLLADRAHSWSNEARQRFDRLCANNQHLHGKVYSVVQGVVAIELLSRDGAVNVNKELLNAGVAVSCDESYESKMNHDLRNLANELTHGQIVAYNKEQIESAFKQMREIDPPAPKECFSDVVLKGAYSPLETTVHPLMYGSREKIVNIEWNSVNSVLLDTDPQQMHEKLVIAANVGQNELSSTLTLRHTTVMPNVPGLPAIMALLFCPTAEFRYDPERVRYVSVLCGLGSDDYGTPFFPEHDLLVNVDADLDTEDVQKINHVRHLMDFMMYCNDGQDQPSEDPNRLKVPMIIKENLNYLLKKHRKYREPQAVANAWEWKSVPEDDILELTDKDMAERAVIYPLHSPHELRMLSLDQLAEMKKENDNLKQLVGRTPLSSAVLHTCKLCGTLPMPTHAMRIHLYSNAHLEKEEDFAGVSS